MGLTYILSKRQVNKLAKKNFIDSKGPRLIMSIPYLNDNDPVAILEYGTKKKLFEITVAEAFKL